MASFSCILCLCLPPAALAYSVPLKNGNKATLPNVSYIDESGASHTVDASKNKLTAVHLWATWCVPCVSELPEVDATAKHYKDNGLNIIAISLDTNHATVETFFDQYHILVLPRFLDNRMATFKSLSDGGLPLTVFFNAEGKEIARAEGPLNWKSEAVISFIKQQLQ